MSSNQDKGDCLERRSAASQQPDGDAALTGASSAAAAADSARSSETETTAGAAAAAAGQANGPSAMFTFSQADIDSADNAAAAAPAIPSYPTTPRLFCNPENPPDTVENVSSQAGAIFRSFVFERYARDRQEGRLDPGTPDSPELAQERPPPLSQEARIGRQLAEIGDDIDRRYKSQFDDMVKSLESQLTDYSASFDVFRMIAARLFRDGTITWGRVVALFFFGYRIAVENIRNSVSGFLRQIAEWICRFLATERIANWIARHGGWASIFYLTETDSSSGEEVVRFDWRLLTSLGLLTAFCVVMFRFSRQQ